MHYPLVNCTGYGRGEFFSLRQLPGGIKCRDKTTNMKNRFSLSSRSFLYLLQDSTTGWRAKLSGLSIATSAEKIFPCFVSAPGNLLACIIRHFASVACFRPRKTAIVYTRHCSKPRIKMSLGRFLPMKTILLAGFSPSSHLPPTSLPII